MDAVRPKMISDSKNNLKLKTIHKIMAAPYFVQKKWYSKDRFYINLPDVVDADLLDSQSILLQNSNLHYSLFLIQTKVGLGPPERIKDVEIRFKFNFSGDDGSKILQVKAVAPDDKVFVNGTISRSEINRSDAKVSGSAWVGLEYLIAKAGIGGSANIEKQKHMEKTTQVPSYVVELTSNGSGTDAFWHIRQGEGITPTGEYQLQILFELRDELNKLKSKLGMFQISHSVTINNKKCCYDENNKETLDFNIPIEFHIN